jgi:hypothetical protein
MSKETLNLEIKANIKQVLKDTEILQAQIENTNRESKSMVDSFGAFGVTVGSVKQKFKDLSKVMTNNLKNIYRRTLLVANSFKLMFGGQMKIGAKVLFSVIKAGIAATGIGALVVAFGSLVQYFRDSEVGASKFKQITSQLGVVLGNVTDIVSNLGKSFFKLITKDFKGFKDGLAEVTEGVKNFGATTKKEMEAANQLEKDRLALQQFERQALVEKAKTEKDIMKLRLQARDFEKFSAEERLGFMREANKLADEQLTKDLHVAKEKLRFQQVENSFSKSTKENLDAEAQLEAQVHQIQRSNFSERKRMKSEEQAVVREIAADNKAASAARQKELDDEIAKTKELMAVEQERVNKLTVDAAALLDKYYESQLTAQQKEENAVYDKYFAIIEGKKALGEDVTELEKAQASEIAAIQKKHSEEQLKFSEMTQKQQLGIASKTAGEMATILGKETAAGKTMAIVQATIDTYASANAAYKAMSGIPVIGPGLGAVAAGAAIASGIANVKAIAGTGGGGGGGVSGGASASTPATPAPQMMSGQFELGGGIAPEPVKAFVITDEMTSSQAQLANIRRRATI